MGNPLFRYLLTLRRLWGTSLAMQFEYQANLVLEVVAAVANLLGSLLLLSLFYGEGRALGGWSWPQALVVLGVYTLLEGITSTWLRPNLSTIVGHVQQGTLDFVLLKPIDSQFWLSTSRVSLMGLPEITTGLGLMIWAAGQAGIRTTPWAVDPDPADAGGQRTAFVQPLVSGVDHQHLVCQNLECHRSPARRLELRPLPDQLLSLGRQKVFHHGATGGLSHHRAR
jgi:hypothetical protein